jgi:hypothetical protein
MIRGMSFDTLSHTPEFELPMNAPSAPADLIALLEECHEGLSKAIISKMVRRNKYEQVASITCQENPSKKSHPAASPDDIAEYCMMVMQYESDKSDNPGNYKVTLFGPPGKGRFERSKHVDLSDGDGEARSKTMLSEGDLLEHQQQYIGELHSQVIGMIEGMNAMASNAMRENKEMMKIVSESQRRLGDVEAQRLRHELELKIHGDEVKQQEIEQEQKMERWRELLGVVKETGAFEAIAKVLVTKMKQAQKSGDDDDDDGEEKKSKKKAKNKDEKKAKGDQEKKSDGDDSDSLESRSSKAKKKKKRSGKKKEKSEDKPSKSDDDSDSDEATQEEIEDAMRGEALKLAEKNPLAVTAEILRMSIENNEQWDIIEATLTEEQFKLFNKILNCDDDTVIEKKLKALYRMKGARRLLKLESHLEEDQQKFVDILIDVASS